MIPDYCSREDNEEYVIWRRKDTGVLFIDYQDEKKCILKVKKDDLLLERVEYFKNLNHNNVQRIYHLELMGDHYYVVAEMLDITLKGFLQKKREKSDTKYEITSQEIRTVIDSLIDGYDQFSSKDWCYKALTPSFICSYHLSSWKFSLMSCVITRHNFCPLLSEFNFLPPENRRKVENLKEADIYMLGQIIVHMITYEIKPLSETTVDFLDWDDIQCCYSEDLLCEITEFLKVAEKMVKFKPQDRIKWEQVKTQLKIDLSISKVLTNTSQRLIYFDQTTQEPGLIDKASRNLEQDFNEEISRQQLATQIRDSNRKIARGAIHHKEVQTDPLVAVEVIRYRDRSRGRTHDRKIQIQDINCCRAEQILKISCEKIKAIVLLLDKIQHIKLVEKNKITSALLHLQYFKSQPVLSCLQKNSRQLADEAELDKETFAREVAEFCEKNRESMHAIIQTAQRARQPNPDSPLKSADDCFNCLGQYWNLILQEKNEQLLKLYITVFTMDIVYPLWQYHTIQYGKIVPSC